MRLSLACVALGSILLALSTGCASVEDEELSDSQESAAKKKTKDDQKDKDKGATPKGTKERHRFEVIQHNLGGGAENVGTPDGLAYTIAQIEERKPDVVMLQEVCSDQYDAFKAKFAGWETHFIPMRTSHSGCANKAKGQVLASPRAMSEYRDVDLLDMDGDKRFTLSCANVPLPGTQRSVRACVTHLHVGGTDPDGSARTRQAKRVANAVAGEVGDGRVVVIAGDLNTGPDKPILDPLYRLGLDGKANGGSFDEADQTDPRNRDFAKREVTCAANECRSGAPTTTDGPKLDYVFFSHNRTAEVGAQVFGFGGSHHSLYAAWGVLEF